MAKIEIMPVSWVNGGKVAKWQAYSEIECEDGVKRRIFGLPAGNELGAYKALENECTEMGKIAREVKKCVTPIIKAILDRLEREAKASGREAPAYNAGEENGTD